MIAASVSRSPRQRQDVVRVHAVPVGGVVVVPAMAAVIHRDVVSNWNRPSATRSLNVHIAAPLTSGRPAPRTAHPAQFP